MFRSLFVLCGAVALSGCAVFGESSFSCSAPDGVSCQSITGGYANAMSSNIPGQARSEHKKEFAVSRESVPAHPAVSPSKASSSDGISSDEFGFSMSTPTLPSESKSVISGFELITPLEREKLLAASLVGDQKKIRSGEVVVGVTVFPWKDDSGVLHDVSRFFFVAKESGWNVDYVDEVTKKDFGRIRDFRGVYAK